MNRKISLVMIIVFALVTAAVHLALGGMIGMRAGGGFPVGGPPQGVQPPNGGLAPGSGQPPLNAPPTGGAPGGIGFLPLPILFILNGIGYLALLALLVLPVPYLRQHPGFTHWVLIGYTALTFVLYIAINGFGSLLGNPLAMVSKAAELLLIICTFLRWWVIRKAAPAPAPGILAAA